MDNFLNFCSCKVKEHCGKVIAFGVFLALLFFGFWTTTTSPNVSAGASHNVSGYAWSDTIGWISFNCLDPGTCGTKDYGVNIDAVTGSTTGYAWSENIGWIAFSDFDGDGDSDGSDMTISGSPCTPNCKAMLSGSALTGWARAIAVQINTPLSSLVGHWKFDNSALDSSGNGNNGSVVGSPSYVSGQYSQAIQLSGPPLGPSQYVSVPHSASLNLNQVFTVSAWVKTSVTGTTTTVVSKSRPNFADHMPFALRITGGGKVQLYRWNQPGGSLSFTDTSSQVVNDGLWHHVVISSSGSSNHKIYVDGVLRTTSSLLWGNETNTNPVLIGVHNNNALWNYINGTIDDVRIYNEALSDAQVATLYSTGNLGSSSLDPQAGGWDGWIKLNGTAPDYGVTKNGNFFEGFAWGSDVVGWVSFSSKNCDANGDGYSDGTPTGCPGPGTPLIPYTVSTPPSAPPTVTFTASPPSPLNSGETTTLSWVSENATYCTAAGGWSGFKASSGSQLVGPLFTDTSFSIACSNLFGHSATSTLNIIVGTPDFDLNKSEDMVGNYVGGFTDSANITVTPLNGFTGDVELSATPSSFGGVLVSYIFNPTTITAAEYSTGSILTASTSEPLPEGTHTITVTGVSGTIEKTIEILIGGSQVVPKFEEF